MKRNYYQTKLVSCENTYHVCYSMTVMLIKSNTCSAVLLQKPVVKLEKQVKRSPCYLKLCESLKTLLYVVLC